MHQGLNFALQRLLRLLKKICSILKVVATWGGLRGTVCSWLSCALMGRWLLLLRHAKLTCKLPDLRPIGAESKAKWTEMEDSRSVLRLWLLLWLRLCLWLLAVTLKLAVILTVSARRVTSLLGWGRCRWASANLYPESDTTVSRWCTWTIRGNGAPASWADLLPLKPTLEAAKV